MTRRWRLSLACRARGGDIFEVRKFPSIPNSKRRRAFAEVCSRLPCPDTCPFASLLFFPFSRLYLNRNKMKKLYLVLFTRKNQCRYSRKPANLVKIGKLSLDLPQSRRELNERFAPSAGKGKGGGGGGGMNKPDWMPADAQPVTLYNKPGSASGKETSPNPGSCS